MKELIARDEYGVFADENATTRVDSLFVAQMFGKAHKKVLRDIERITDPESGLSAEFVRANFGPMSYRDSYGRKQKAYLLTRDGFTILVMGYTGKKAMHYKELYIRRFDEMEAQIETRLSQKREYPRLTANIALIHEPPKPHHFINECDMLNRIVTGMSAKDFREKHGIEKGASIRPYLTPEQAKMMDELQSVDVGFLIAYPDFQTRKAALIAYRDRRAAHGRRINERRAHYVQDPL